MTDVKGACIFYYWPDMQAVGISVGKCGCQMLSDPMVHYYISSPFSKMHLELLFYEFTLYVISYLEPRVLNSLWVYSIQQFYGLSVYLHFCSLSILQPFVLLCSKGAIKFVLCVLLFEQIFLCSFWITTSYMLILGMYIVN